MKVKMFGGDNYAEFEKAINTFIQDKRVVDIKYTALLLPLEYTNGVVTRNIVTDRALIVYEEA